MEKLDAACMVLIAIGESIKNLDKVTNGKMLPTYPDIPWKRVMGMRDVIAHHYFDVDADVVYSVISKERTGRMLVLHKYTRKSKSLFCSERNDVLLGEKQCVAPREKAFRYEHAKSVYLCKSACSFYAAIAEST